MNFFGYLAPADLASGHDPVRILRSAFTRAALIADPSYDPDHVSLWAAADISDVENPPVLIRNDMTNDMEPACICQVATP
jgi:hypothetical protein